MTLLRATSSLLLALALAAPLAGCPSDSVTQNDDDSATGGGPYDVTLSLTAFTPHDGQTVGAAVVETSSGTVVATTSGTVASGTLTLTMEGVAEDGTAYTLNYYADFNNNGTCDPPTTDHVWTIDLGTVTGNVTANESHNTDWVDVCDTLN